MTCIYDAWSEALRIGHDQIQLKKEPILQQTMFDEYVHVDGDNVKAEKVIRSVRRDISDEAYLDVYYATLSAEEDALQAIYNFLRVGFAVGSKVLEQYSNPHVMRMLELRRKVGNESHHLMNLHDSSRWTERSMSVIWNPKVMWSCWLADILRTGCHQNIG